MSKSRIRNKARSKHVVDEADIKDDDDGKDTGWKGTILLWAKDFVIALGIIIVLVIVLFVYTGNWPPLVVVESNSMMQEDGYSSVGVIDTGDMVLVKKVKVEYTRTTMNFEGEDYKVKTGLKDLTTWTDHKDKHYSNWGDVIIFKKNGNSDSIPVIHRAVVWLEVNRSRAHLTPPDYSYDIPSMDLWGQKGTVVIKDYPAFGKNGDDKVDLTLELSELLRRAQVDGEEPQSGYITKGDWNHNQVDQFNLIDPATNKNIGLVRPQWIIGKAKFELPWFGLIKLFITGKLTSANPAPKHSWLLLGLTMAIVICSVVAIDFGIAFATKRYKKRKGGGGDDDDDAQEEEGANGRRRGQRRGGGRGEDRSNGSGRGGERGGGRNRGRPSSGGGGKDRGPRGRKDPPSKEDGPGRSGASKGRKTK